jgi:hypothetical protein
VSRWVDPQGASNAPGRIIRQRAAGSRAPFPKGRPFSNKNVQKKCRTYILMFCARKIVSQKLEFFCQTLLAPEFAFYT